LSELDSILNGSKGKVRAFLSSRENVSISKRFATRSNTYILTTGNDNPEATIEIKNYIQTAVEKGVRSGLLLDGDVSPALKNRIIETLNHRARGM
jgi:hypothetical protein